MTIGKYGYLITAMLLACNCASGEDRYCSEEQHRSQFPKVYGYPLGSINLESLINILGVAERRKYEYEITGFYGICYEDESGTLTIFEWTGDYHVYSIEITALEKGNKSYQCARLNRGLPELIPGLKLGISKTNAERLLEGLSKNAERQGYFEANKETNVYVAYCMNSLPYSDDKTQIRSFDYKLQYEGDKVVFIAANTLFFD